MYYKGKLYGKSRGRYFEMEETSEDVDRLKERIKELEALVSKNESLHDVVRSGCTKCANCSKEIVIRDESTIKIMHLSREYYVCSEKCMWEYYK